MPDDPMAKLEAKQAQEKKKRMVKLYGDVVGQTEKKQLDDDLDGHDR